MLDLELFSMSGLIQISILDRFISTVESFYASLHLLLRINGPRLPTPDPFPVWWSLTPLPPSSFRPNRTHKPPTRRPTATGTHIPVGRWLIRSHPGSGSFQPRKPLKELLWLCFSAIEWTIFTSRFSSASSLPS